MAKKTQTSFVLLSPLALLWQIVIWQRVEGTQRIPANGSHEGMVEQNRAWSPQWNSPRGNPPVGTDQLDQEASLTKRSLTSGVSLPLGRSRRRRHSRLPHTIAKRLMDSYYRCLDRSHTGGSSRSVFRALIVKEGQSLTLHCHQCFRPSINPEDKLQITWRHLRQDGTAISRIQPKGNYHLTDHRDLVIKTMDSEDSGQYFCMKNNQYQAVYQVDVLLMEKYSMVREDFGNEALPSEILTENNLSLYSSWSPWTECSQCGRPGVRTKTGLCTVKKNEPDLPIEPVDVLMFYYFDGGLPCRSSALPAMIQAVPTIRHRRSEILVGACQVPCPTTAARTVIRDQKGHVLEVVEAGYYSMHEKPQMEQGIKRQVLHKFEGSHLVLKCPTAEKMVRWQNGSAPLKFLTVRRKTRGRVFIDINSQLHIKGALRPDSSIYSCWKQEKLLATIKLVITEGMMMGDAGPYITYSLAGITLLCLVAVACCLYNGPQSRAAL